MFVIVYECECECGILICSFAIARATALLCVFVCMLAYVQAYYRPMDECMYENTVMNVNICGNFDNVVAHDSW